MHIVHLPENTKNGILASAMGMIFDVEEYTAKLNDDQINIIDSFFDGLMLDFYTTPKKIDIV